MNVSSFHAPTRFSLKFLIALDSDEIVIGSHDSDRIPAMQVFVFSFSELRMQCL